MANKSQNTNTSKLWVRVTCGIMGGLMVACVVFMLIQMLVNA